MKAKKQTNKYSGPDLNDKFMRSIGFSRDPFYDLLDFNATNAITYWINERDCRIITEKKVKLSRVEIINLIMDAADLMTKQKICRSIRDMK